jgi:peptidoglycan/xylan/chitin deacetylase (PgdA/CDA1 family)
MKLSGLTIAPLLAACLSGGMLRTNATTPSQTTGASQPSRAMALTFDDLPYVPAAQPDALAAAQRVTTALLRMLASHSAPAVAFVNEGKLAIVGEVEARTALIKQWVDSGVVLGNHTYSHADLNTLSVEEFQNEIVKGDVVSRRLMQPRQPYQLYFRHPQTHTGDTPAKKEAIEQFLTARGYKVAPHTIDSSDFIFNVGYVRSLRAGDQATAERLRTAYVEFVLAATEFAEQTTPKIFGRDIPQTIVLHANDINADTLGEILHRLEGRGYRFVTLEYAMTDPVYQTKDALITKSGPTWLWRWMKSKGQNVSFKGDPEPPQWVIDLYTAKGVK